MRPLSAAQVSKAMMKAQALDANDKARVVLICGRLMRTLSTGSPNGI